MNETSETCSLATSTATPSVISSLASADGATPCDSPSGLTMNRSGQEAAHASRSASEAALREFSTRGTYGPLFIGSSRSAVLQRSLESRLRARLGVNGSPEYALTWKTWDMPSGPPICALRASARRTSGSGFGGLPTPAASDHKGSGRPRKNRGPGNNLRDYFRQKHGWLYPPARIVLWLMGYPDEWACCAALATRSSRKSRRNSSERS